MEAFVFFSLLLFFGYYIVFAFFFLHTIVIFICWNGVCCVMVPQ